MALRIKAVRDEMPFFRFLEGPKIVYNERGEAITLYDLGNCADFPNDLSTDELYDKMKKRERGERGRSDKSSTSSSPNYAALGRGGGGEEEEADDEKSGGGITSNIPMGTDSFGRNEMGGTLEINGGGDRIAFREDFDGVHDYMATAVSE